MTSDPWAPTLFSREIVTPQVLREGRWEYSEPLINVNNVINNRYYENQKKIWFVSGLNDLLETGSAPKNNIPNIFPVLYNDDNKNDLDDEDPKMEMLKMMKTTMMNKT